MDNCSRLAQLRHKKEVKMRGLCLLVLLVALTQATPVREAIESYAVSTDSVKFYLYTKSNPSTAQELIIGNESSVKNSKFNNKYRTKIVIHGWKNSYKTIPNPQLRDAYLSRGDFNIIAVDWSAYADLNYVSSRGKVPIVGEKVAQLIDFLQAKFGLSFSDLVVIGHSLGAHVAGFTGKSVKNGKLEAIVGLDPAFPLYSFSNPETRLASTDAKYVQTIQTNGNLKGFLQPIGSAAFYPNWGRNQPGCGADLDGACAHARSVLYYAEAVRGYSFQPIYKCASYKNIADVEKCSTLAKTAAIGDPLEVPRINGIFYLTTTSAAPFGHK